MQMERFIEKIHEHKDEQRYVGQMPRVRIRKATSVNPHRRGKSTSKTPMGMYSHGYGDQSYLM